LNFDKKSKIIVATASSLSEKVLKKEDFKAISHTIKVGDQLDFDFTEEFSINSILISPILFQNQEIFRFVAEL
jgi:hypothetical protein